MWKLSFLIVVGALIQTASSVYFLDHIVDLKEQDFDYVVGTGHEIWALCFYIPQQTKSDLAIPAFNKASNMMLGLVKFGSINVDRQPILAYRFDIRTIPTVIFINRDFEDIKYIGPLTDAGIIDFAGKLLMQQVEYGIQGRLSDNRSVKELSDEEMIKHGKNGTKFWLIAFYNSKDNVTRVDFIKMVEYAADVLRGSVNVGAFDITKRSTPYMYDEIPTVVLFHGKKSDRYEIEYNDTFYGNKLVDFVQARVKTPKIQELWTENILTDMCQLKKYCMLTFIPAISKCDTKCKDNYKAVLAEVAEDHKMLPAGWALIRRGVMRTAEKVLEIGDDSQLPIFIIVEVKTLRSEYLPDKFDAVNIKLLIREIIEGEGFTGRTIPIFDHLPRYKPWLRDEL